ncbi:MAG: hypothetical protein ACQKBT_01825 [Puniceicoccales bacterium]
MTRISVRRRLSPIFLSVIFLSSAAHAVTVFEDDFDYEDVDALRSAYPIVETNGGAPVNLGTNAAIDPDQPYLSLSNVIVERGIGTTLTEDWTVSYNVIHTSYQRYTWFAMLNDEGTEGYAFSWNSGSDTSYAGNGYVTIQKQTEAVSGWNDSSVFTSLSPNVNSGHNAIGGDGEGMALFEASWDSATGTITLSVDGVELASVTDTSFDSFSKIQIKGNAYQAYDNLVITSSIPEVSTSSAFMGMIVLFACVGNQVSRRRR